ncbi:histidine phosphatase family protein [Streptomyces sp. NPDC127084]|uniref:histidine phosphatase family protein n=1 Tax=Streptomyces sp. NPDC127084 TaxID=3347133 RepID=UPI00365A361B
MHRRKASPVRSPNERSILSNLFLVRHGESTCNSVHRIAGQKDAPLNPLGRAQAEKIREKHESEKVDRCYVSPLSRAHETAEIIFSGRATTISVDDRLIERDFGSYTLHSKALLQRKFGIVEYERAMNSDSWSMRGGEKIDFFKKRIQEFYEHEVLPALESGLRVCVVSHKYVIELICRFILHRNDAYDLRLPNSEMIRGDRISKYVRHEQEKPNMARDWTVVHHPLLFCIALTLGFFLNLLGLRASISPYFFGALLIASTTITMSRIELENLRAFIRSHSIIKMVAVRYVALPVILALILRSWGPRSSEIILLLLLVISAPSSMVTPTLSRSLGGMILPSFSVVLLSSLVSPFILAIVLNLTRMDDLVAVFATSVWASGGIVLAAYFCVLRFRARSPIRVAKFGERNAYISVMLLVVFIVFVMLKLDISTFRTDLPLAIGFAVSLRLISALFKRRNNVGSMDDYIAMSYPNMFAVIIIASVLGNVDLEQLAIWTLLSTFTLSFVDAWYVGRLVIPASDTRWAVALSLPRQLY